MASIILHLSDIHVGPPFNADKARLVIEEAWRIKPNLTIISGDLVQRADFKQQWLDARSFINELPTPVVTVMGNHDVPMYNPLARIFWPNRSYRRYISPQLAPVWSNHDLVMVGVNTSRSFVVDSGALSDRQLLEVEQTLARFPDALCKVVVMHHHPVMPPGETRSVIRNAAAARQLYDRAGVELVLCGHTHASYIGNTLEFDPTLQAGTVIVQAGTATSRRGRRWYRGKNAFNVLAIEDERIIVTQHLFLEDAGRFMPVSQHRFPRRSAGIYALPVEARAEVVAATQSAATSAKADAKIEQLAQTLPTNQPEASNAPEQSDTQPDGGITAEPAAEQPTELEQERTHAD